MRVFNLKLQLVRYFMVLGTSLIIKTRGSVQKRTFSLYLPAIDLTKDFYPLIKYQGEEYSIGIFQNFTYFDIIRI